MERAVQLDPEDASSRAVVLLAEGYSAGGKTESAIAAFQEALRLAPERSEYHHNLALIYHRNGYLREAEKVYLAALEREPGLAGGHYNLGNLQLDMGRLQVARESYETALWIQPEHENTLINLAAVFVKLDCRADAVAGYRRFLGPHGQDHHMVAAVRGKIGRLEGVREEP